MYEEGIQCGGGIVRCSTSNMNNYCTVTLISRVVQQRHKIDAGIRSQMISSYVFRML